MKTIKIILLLTTISLFRSVPYGVAEARDCSNPKGFHAKMMCKLTGSSGSSVTAADESEKKSNGFFQKLKNFGGTKIGESDK